MSRAFPASKTPTKQRSTAKSSAKSVKPKTKAPAKSKSKADHDPIDDYLVESSTPIASLWFILPLIVLYEIGTALYGRDMSGAEYRVTAFVIVHEVLRFLEAGGRIIPACLVVLILITAHLIRQEKWRLDANSVGWMYAESIIWAAPLIIVGKLFAWLAATQTALMEGNQGSRIVASIGAGIYEELVFRLIGITLIALILREIAGMPTLIASIWAVAATSILFSSYHYLGNEQFRLADFVFRALAGVYFGVLYLTRGFGVTAGCHVAYDVIAVGLTRP